MKSSWDKIPPTIPDLVFNLNGMAEAALEPKINLVIGAYRDEEGKPSVLKVIKKAEKYLSDNCDTRFNKEYLPIDGYAPFRHAAMELLLGSEYYSNYKNKIAAVQSISGTGACRLLAEFYARSCPKKTNTIVYFSNPTWANHQPIFRNAGFTVLRNYRYYDPVTCLVTIKSMLEDMTLAPEGSIFVLHICAHNPTGADPSIDEWKMIANVMKKRKHYAMFDSAYQGYASGDLMRDSRPARIFLDEGLEFTVAQSFSKNMGLYSERIGLASVYCANENAAKLVHGRLKNIIRPMYSNPPSHGALLAAHVLTDKELRPEWEGEVKHMSQRILKMRQLLRSELERLNVPPPGKNWEHITKQIGMFSYLGLNRKQCFELQKRRVFLLPTGRISVAGLIESTTKDLAKHMLEVVKKVPYSDSKM